MTFKKSLLLLSFLLFAADTLGAQEQFKNRPGYMELSGRMIARPLQDGPNLEIARDRLQSTLIKFESRTDEYIIAVPEGLTADQVSQ